MQEEPIGGIQSILGVLLIFVFVLFLAYWFTKTAGKRLSAGGFTGKQIELIDQAAIGQDRALMIVRVAGKVLLLGVTAQRIDKLDELDAGAFRDLPQQPAESSFSSILKGALAKGKEQQMERRREKRDE